MISTLTPHVVDLAPCATRPLLDEANGASFLKPKRKKRYLSDSEVNDEDLVIYK